MNKNQGFTLIELLVVVLIIGILSAVALPQYQVAVEKARVARMLPLFKSLINAQEVYKMQNGDYTTDIDLLDVSVDYASKTEVNGGDGRAGIKYTLSDGNNFRIYTGGSMVVSVFPAGYIIDYYGSARGNNSGSGLCYPDVNGGLAERVCKSMGTKTSSTSSKGTNVYMFYN